VWHDAETLRQGGRDWHLPAGFFLDWQSDLVRSWVYELRTTIRPQPSCRQIGEHYGFQGWLRVTRAYDAWNRRVNPDGARGGRPLSSTDHRRWTRTARRADGTTAYERMFGIEIEFGIAGPDLATARRAIIADCNAAGLTAHNCWHTHNTDTALGGWQGMYDGSIVHGGELVSPPLPGTDAGMAELSTAMAIVRRHGGTASAGQGLHTNIGVGDYTDADLARLARNVAATQRHMLAYMPDTRRNSQWCQPLSAYDSERNAASLGAGGRQVSTRYTLVNYANATAATSAGARRVEFRGMGHTLNMTKLRPWVRFHLALVTATKAGVVLDANMALSEVLTALAPHGMTAWSAEAFRARCERRPLARVA
jgi:hypothetical protein